EDGIRDFHVTGVQTCALPISTSTLATGSGGSTGVERQPATPATHSTIHRPVRNRIPASWSLSATDPTGPDAARATACPSTRTPRSEERRVGSDCRNRWWAYQK